MLAESPPRFILVGFSMGGFVARVLALMAPERVEGVAFICSSARGNSPAEEAAKQARIAQARGAAGAGVARRAHSQALHPDRENDPELLDRLRGMSRRLGKETMIRQLSLTRADGYADLELIACPALVVAARQDRLRRFEETERMAKHLPRARFAVIEDCGHMAPLERPRELGAVIREWVAESVS
ncbi:MAG: alpha/beta hydrolase [Rhodospirillales bacterium]|nr:alpha/beta hydrolase [Rhodospirillales bacterium]